MIVRARDITLLPQLTGANIWVDGASITSEGYALGASWPRQTHILLHQQGVESHTVNGFNGLGGFVETAVSGQCTRNMIGDRTVGVPTATGGEASVEIDSKLHPFRQNVLIVGGDGATNDLFYYGLGEANRVTLSQQNTRNYCKARQLAGWYVLLMSGSPRANGYLPGGTTNPAQYEADSVALDAMLLATHQEYANLYFDFRKMLPTFTATEPYRLPDLVHPTTYGSGLIASALSRFMLDNFRKD